MSTRLGFIVIVLSVILIVGCSSVSDAAPTTASPLSSGLSSGNVQIGSLVSLTMIADGNTHLPDDLFFRATLAGNKLFGAAGGEGSDQVTLYEVDLETGLTYQFGSLYSGIINMRASDQYVVWDVRGPVGYKVHIYDIGTGQEDILPSAGSPDTSGDIVVWIGVREIGGKKTQSIFGQNMVTGEEFPIVSQPSIYPRISGQWIIYLTSIGHYEANIQAHNLSTGKDFKIGTMPMLGERIGIVEWYPVISGKHVIWISAQDEQLHHYNLDSHTDRVLPVPTTPETTNRMPRSLELDGDILVYSWGQRMGYDLIHDVAFPVPSISQSDYPDSKWRTSMPVLISRDRLVWQTRIDQQIRIHTVDILRDQ